MTGEGKKGDGSGKSYGIFLFYDMTTIRGLERIRKDFVANVSHEIRTPLTSIRGYAEALTDGALADPDLSRKFLGIISGQADRLSHMVNDLLELSRLESGTVELNLGEIDLGLQADRMQEVFSSRLAEREIRLMTDFPRPFSYVSDESLTDLVLTNLLDNAIKYSPPGREVRISAEKMEGTVTIRVIDNGTGIPREDLPRIFERFYRVDRSRSSSVSGTGLGLSIVRHVMTLLKGRVEVRSVRKNRRRTRRKVFPERAPKRRPPRKENPPVARTKARKLTRPPTPLPGNGTRFA